MNRILVDTNPVNAFSRGSINLGLEIVAEKMMKTGGLKRCHYLDVLSPTSRHSDEICFSVPYVLHALNIVPFLKRNGIEPLKEKRHGSPRIIVGGSAIHPLHALDAIADEQFLGEFEGSSVDTSGFRRLAKLNSEVYTSPLSEGAFEPLVHKVHQRQSPHPLCKGGNRLIYPPSGGLGGVMSPYQVDEAVVELARGCPNCCQFCEYRWIIGGGYREKPFHLLAEQLSSLHPEAFITQSKGSVPRKLVKRLTVRTSNLSACTYLPDLSTLCQGLNRKLLWAEVSPPDANKIIDFLEPLGITRINFGIESFTESVRKKMCKPISDSELAILLRVLMQKLSFIKINLIYGLPGETDYKLWFDWLHRIAEIRKHIKHPVRLEFSISNLELGGLSREYLSRAFHKAKAKATAALLAEPIDFHYKENVFLPRWISTLRDLDLMYRNVNLFPQDLDDAGNCRIHGRDFGRSGRTELNHLVIIALRNLPASVVTDALLNCFPRGAHRYFSPQQAKSFLNKLNFN